MNTGIPWYIFSLIGAIVAVSSYLVSVQQLAIFIFAGVLLFLWGILKFLFAKLNEGSGKKHVLGASHTVRCDNCGIKIHPLFTYCPKCGKRHK